MYFDEIPSKRFKSNIEEIGVHPLFCKTTSPAFKNKQKPESKRIEFGNLRNLHFHGSLF